MKGISESISTIIIVSVLLGIVAVFIAYSSSAISQSGISLEYESYRSAFILLAQSVPSIMSSGEFSTVISSQISSIGYSEGSPIEIVLGATTITVPCKALESKFPGLVKEPQVIYGERANNIAVGDERLIGRAELVRKDALYLRFDTCRIIATVEPTYENGTTLYLLRLRAVELVPVMRVRGGNELRISARFGEAPYVQTSVINGINLRILRGNMALTIRDIYPEYPGGNVVVQVIKYKLFVEVIS